MAAFRPYPVLLLLLLSLACVPAAAAADVKPPVNVTLTCRNLNNVVSWDYGEFLPGLKFEVTIMSTDSKPQLLSVAPPALSAVFQTTNPQNDFFVQVQAVSGQSKSASNGIEFSYVNSPAEQKCYLDFPPVNVIDRKDGYVRFHFTHPQVFLNENLSMETSDDELSELDYNVAVNSQESKRLTCYTRVCEGQLSAPEEEKLCVKVNGWMDKMVVKAEREYCAETFDYTAVYIISGLFAAVVVGLVIFLVFKQKTKPATYTPSSMTFAGKVKQWTMGVTQEQIQPVEVEPPSPTPLLASDEEKMVSPTELCPPEPVLRLATGVSVEDEGVCGDEESENGEASGYMHGRTLEDEEESAYTGGGSGYEKREVVVSIAPDEEAKGYRN